VSAFGCAAERLYPRQLRNEDFNDPSGYEDEDGRLNTQWIEGGDLPGFAAYRITFPEEGGNELRSKSRRGKGHLEVIAR
jgi:hypothetical protein